MSEAVVDSPDIFCDSLTPENIDASVADITQEVEIVEIDDDSTPLTSELPANKKKSKPNIFTSLPLSRVKKILKLDPDVHLVTSDAVKLVAYCTERFVEQLTKVAVASAKERGKKTVNNSDVQVAIRRSWLFYMLDEALDEWPETTTTRPKSAASNKSNDGEITMADEEVNDAEVVEEADDGDAGEQEDVEEMSDTEDIEIINFESETVELDISTEVIEETLMDEAEDDDEINEDEISEESDIENQNDDDAVKDIEDF